MPPSLALRSKYQDSAGLVDHEVEQLSPLGQVTQLVVQVADEAIGLYPRRARPCKFQFPC